MLHDGEEMLNSVKVVLHLVKNASYVVDSDGAFVVVLQLCVAASVVLEQEEIVVESLQTLVRVLFALGTVLSDQLQELEVAPDCKVLAFNYRFLTTFFNMLVLNKLGKFIVISAV